jgi:hypothetical protein
MTCKLLDQVEPSRENMFNFENLGKVRISDLLLERLTGLGRTKLWFSQIYFNLFVRAR